MPTGSSRWCHIQYDCWTGRHGYLCKILLFLATNRSRDIRLPHFVANDNDAGVRSNDLIVHEHCGWIETYGRKQDAYHFHRRTNQQHLVWFMQMVRELAVAQEHSWWPNLADHVHTDAIIVFQTSEKLFGYVRNKLSEGDQSPPSEIPIKISLLLLFFLSLIWHWACGQTAADKATFWIDRRCEVIELCKCTNNIQWKNCEHIGFLSPAICGLFWLNKGLSSHFVCLQENLSGASACGTRWWVCKCDVVVTFAFDSIRRLRLINSSLSVRNVTCYG